MSESPRARDSRVPPAEQAARAREQAEAEDAVAAVMMRESQKAARRVAQEHHVRRPLPLKALLLLTMLLFNAYLWFGHPDWLTFRAPDALSVDYYESSWRIAVYLQRQRVEEFRANQGHLPASAQQAGQPVTGVKYTPLARDKYQLAAGAGERRFVYLSTDSLSVLMGRTLLQMGLVAGGVR